MSDDPRTTPAQWLELLIERAPQLRRAGVTRIALEGCTVDLAPVEPAAVHVPEEEAELLDPLDDPRTFPGGRMPTFQRITEESR